MDTQKTIIILGGGTGGLVAANELSKKAGKKAKIILIDKNKNHVFAPSFLYLMLGKRQAEKIQRPLSRLRKKGIEFINDEVVRIDPTSRKIKTRKQNFHYDYLIISLGAEFAPQNLSGLDKSGHNLYELKEVEKLRDTLKKFTGGRVAIVISSLPFKCPAAPYEAAFLLDEYFQKKGIRDKTELTIFTPESLPMPAAGPENGKVIRAMVEARNIKFIPEVKLSSVDPGKRELLFSAQGGSASGGERNKTSRFDLLIYVPHHQGPKVIRDSDMGNQMGWISADGKTFKTKYENVFAIGDITAITLVSGKPLPKAGVFAHFEAEVVVENITAELNRLPAEKEYDGRAFCFLELGYGRAGFAGGNFYAEPAPIVKMKRPGRIWHWGKILFEKYWLWKWF